MQKHIIFLLMILCCSFVQLKAQTQPKLVLPIGHIYSVNIARFTPDGKCVVTASNDGTAKIWDVTSGKMLQNLAGHTRSVVSAQLSADGRYVATSSLDFTTKIWDVASGIMLHDLTGHKKVVKTSQFSPDGKRIVTASWDGKAKIWDVASGQLLHDLIGHTKGLYTAQFSPDGKRIVTVSSDNTVKIWDVATGKILMNFTGFSDGVHAAQFAPDGKTILTASVDHTVKIWNVLTGEIMQDMKGHTKGVYAAQFSPDGKYVVSASDDSTAKIWDVTSGKILKELLGHTAGVYAVELSPNGKTIVTASVDKTAKIWDVASGKMLQDLVGHTSYVYSAQFSPDGKYVVTASDDKTTKIWDVASGKMLQDLIGHTRDVTTARFSPDGKIVGAASRDNSVTLWDMTSGILLQDMSGHKGWVNSVHFSPDGKTILTASGDQTAKIWDVASGKILKNFEGHTESVESAQFSPDGSKIVTASVDNTALIWNVDSGKVLKELTGHANYLNSAQFSPNGKLIVTASFDNTSRVWDAATGDLLKVLNGHNNCVTSAYFSPDGNKIVTASWDKTGKIWDVATGKILHDLKGHTKDVNSAEFSPDGKFVVTASEDFTAKIWEVASGNVLHELKGHSMWVNSAHFSPDGKIITTTGSDHKTILWDAVTGKKLYTRLQLSDGDWLVYDEHYRYDGSEGAREYLYFVCGLEIIDLAQMKDALYVPGLVEIIMRGKEINYPKLSELDICDALPLLERLETKAKYYHYKITPRRMGLAYVEVYVNEKKIFTIQPSELKKSQNSYFLKVKAVQLEKHFISGAGNLVNVVAIARKGNSELRSRGAALITVEETGAYKAAPRLFAVMTGVNNYKDRTLTLNFPAKDAADLGKALELSAVKLLGRENVFMYHINSLVTKDNGYTTPEKEGIRRALADIGQKARPEDIIMLFFAGHGVMQGAEDKMFTFLTAEASSENLSGISTRELQDWLSYEGPHKILANKTILIFDACNSGQATQELLALARNDDDTRRIRQVEDLKDKSGMFILAASAPNQAAYELPQYGQGLLTYSLLSVLKNNPDILDDGKFLNVQKWFLESEKYLKQIVESLGYKQDAQPFGTANIRIGIVDEEVANSIVLAKEKPVVVCANVLNTETFNDDLLLKELINKELSSIAERGVNSTVLFSKYETPATNKINIMYQVQGDSVNCQVRLLKGNETLHQASVSGTKTDLGALVGRIIEGVVGYAR